jgi:hypothetical protein
VCFSAQLTKSRSELDGGGGVQRFFPQAYFPPRKLLLLDIPGYGRLNMGSDIGWCGYLGSAGL